MESAQPESRVLQRHLCRFSRDYVCCKARRTSYRSLIWDFTRAFMTEADISKGPAVPWNKLKKRKMFSVGILHLKWTFTKNNMGAATSDLLNMLVAFLLCSRRLQIWAKAGPFSQAKQFHVVSALATKSCPFTFLLAHHYDELYHWPTGMCSRQNGANTGSCGIMSKCQNFGLLSLAIDLTPCIQITGKITE